MKAIEYNPYRTIGILVGATARERKKQVRRLIQDIEIEQEPRDDFSFSKGGYINRTLESVSDADSKLDLDKDKMSAALFWFYNGGHTDEQAFGAIKDGRYNLAIEQWSKLTKAEISIDNASAFNNLSTLYLSGFLSSDYRQNELFEKGIALKLKFLESNFAEELKKRATDKTYSITNRELQLLFLNQVLNEIEYNGYISPGSLFMIIEEASFSAKNDFLRRLIKRSFEQIERKTNETTNKREKDAANAAIAAKSLIIKTSEHKNILYFLAGKFKIKYTSLVNNIAEEILQCAIVYNNYHSKSNNDDFATTTLYLAEKAENLATTKAIKQKCRDLVKQAQKNEYIEQRNFLINKLNALITDNEHNPKTTEQAQKFLSETKPYLELLKLIDDNEGAIETFVVSDNIALVALNMCILHFNQMQEEYIDAELFKKKLNDILILIEQIETMNLTSNFIINTIKPNKDVFIKKLEDIPYLAIKQKLEKLFDSLERNEISKKFYLNEAKPLLKEITSVISENSYIILSTNTATYLYNKCLDETNDAMDKYNNADNYSRMSEVNILKSMIHDVWDVIKSIESMDLSPEFRNKSDQYKSYLLDNAKQLGMNIE